MEGVLVWRGLYDGVMLSRDGWMCSFVCSHSKCSECHGIKPAPDFLIMPTFLFAISHMTIRC